MKVNCKYDKLVSVAALSKMWHPQNPNRHPAEQIALFGKILEAQGWRSPIVVSSRSNLIVAGHGALEAAILNGYKSCPVDFQEFSSAALELAHMSADNELARLSQSDQQALDTLLKGLDAEGLDHALAGIVESLQEPVRLEQVSVKPPPAMTWVLIGVRTVDFGQVNEIVERARAVPGAIVESTVTEEAEATD